MSFQATLKEVNVESVNKGKTKYQIANVVYDYNGEARNQKVMSFANPDTFKRLQTFAPGDVLEITATKNDAGYTQWAKVEKVSDKVEATSDAPKAPGKVLGSNYETPQERADNRLRIVRQSGLNYAINTLSVGAVDRLNPEQVFELAQRYVDWVYESPSQDESNS